MKEEALLVSEKLKKMSERGALWDFPTSVLSENSKQFFFQKKSNRAENTLVEKS